MNSLQAVKEIQSRHKTANRQTDGRTDRQKNDQRLNIRPFDLIINVYLNNQMFKVILKNFCTTELRNIFDMNLETFETETG